MKRQTKKEGTVFGPWQTKWLQRYLSQLKKSVNKKLSYNNVVATVL